MQKLLVALIFLTLGTSGPAAHQRRAAGGGTATLAISVSDPSGAPIPSVLVSVQGPTSRTTRTEGGRIALEKLAPGDYRLRFEQDGFITLERELTARAGAPIDVKVTLTPAPQPPAPPAPPDPPQPATDAEPATASVLDVIDREFVGRAASRVTSLSCSGEVASTLIQLNEPLAEHTHAEADEVFYVVAGEGTAQYGGRQQPLKAGIYLFIPRGVPHALQRTGRNPLIVLSTRSGEPCR